MPIMKKVEPLEFLKTCPFCGKVPTVRHTVYQRKCNAWEDDWQVECSNNDCDVQPSTGSFYSKDLAIGTWNTRPDEVINIREE